MKIFFYSLIKYIKINIYYKFRYKIIHFFYKEKSILNNNDQDYNSLKQLENDGYVIIKNFFEKEFVENIKLEFEKNYKENFENFFYIKHPNRKNINDKININNISENTNYVSLRDPLEYIPLIVKFLNERLYNLIQSYFKCKIGLTSINLRKSFVNNLQDAETNIYHKDENSFNLLKVFIYLNDVDKNAGPFMFVKKTHKKTNLESFKNYRINDKVINSKFSSDDIISLTGKIGDVIIANTRGFHKGKKVINKERNMLTFTFGIHDEYFRKSSKIKINSFILKYNTNYDERFFRFANF